MGDADQRTLGSIEELYLAEQQGLVAAAWMILGSREAAEDAVQSGFAALADRDLATIDYVPAYLRTVVINECRREQRRRGRVDLRASLPEVGLTDDMTDLASVLDRLTARRRMAVVLRYWCDLPVNDIAELMGCRPSTVSSLLHRSHRTLRETLHDH